MGEGSRLGGGPRQMGGDDGSQMVEKGRKIRKKEESFQNTLIPCRPKPFFPPASLSHTSDEVLKELLKMRDQLEELFAGLSLEENFQTSRPLDNSLYISRLLLLRPPSPPHLLPFPPPPLPSPAYSLPSLLSPGSSKINLPESQTHDRHHRCRGHRGRKSIKR
ncbi:unnamed protein product [Closterium sp. NIES-64]|nr:unnamed protein product [Closterium sp. NIES-64]